MVFIVKKSIGFPKCLVTSLILDTNIFLLILQIFMRSADVFISPPLYFYLNECMLFRFIFKSITTDVTINVFFKCFTTKPEIYQMIFS